MTAPRTQQSDTATDGESPAAPQSNDGPELNVYEIHAERTVMTEPGNTDGWIASDTTVTLSE